MVELTKKEWRCFNEYVSDLLELFSQDNIDFVSDNREIYSKEELLLIKEKIEKHMENNRKY